MQTSHDVEPVESSADTKLDRKKTEKQIDLSVR